MGGQTSLDRFQAHCIGECPGSLPQKGVIVMTKTGLSLVLVVVFSMPASAADKGAKGKAPKSETPAAAAAPAEQRARQAIRLAHAPAAEVARTVQQFLQNDQHARRPHEGEPNAAIVPEPVSNSLLVSATPQTMDLVTKLIAALDTPRPMVTIDLCIAEVLLRPRDGKTDGRSSDASAPDKAPALEKDAAAWLAWAKKQGRLEVLHQVHLMTLDNQPAFLKIGGTVPGTPPKPAADGFTIGLTPRTSPKGLVVMELDVDWIRTVNRDGVTNPTVETTMLQATVSANNGQTIVVGGLVETAQKHHQQMVITVTPRVDRMR